MKIPPPLVSVAAKALRSAADAPAFVEQLKGAASGLGARPIDVLVAVGSREPALLSTHESAVAAAFQCSVPALRNRLRRGIAELEAQTKVMGSIGAALATVGLCDAPPRRVKRLAVILVDVWDKVGDAHADKDLATELSHMKAVLLEANKRGIVVIETSRRTNPALSALRADNWVTFDKPDISTFQNTDVHARFEELGITDVIVMGFNQAACVMQSTDDAVQLGYQVHTSFDVMQKMSRSGLSGDPRDPYNHDFDDRFYDAQSDAALAPFYENMTVLYADYRRLPIFDAG